MPEAPTFTFVRFEGHTVRVSANSASEWRLALKEIKLLKKEFALKKRTLVNGQKTIRAAYTDQVRTRSVMVSGRGGIAGMLRAGQRWSRAMARSALAKELAPLERQKQQIEELILGLDKIALEIEQKIATAEV